MDNKDIQTEPANTDAIIRLILKAARYARSDPEAFLTFARKTAEEICRFVFSANLGDTGRIMFDELIKQLCRKGLVPASLEQPLVTIQKYGNFATHDAGIITTEYIVPSLASLKHISKWFFLEYLHTELPPTITDIWSPSQSWTNDKKSELSVTSVQGLLNRGWTMDQVITETMGLDYETLNGLVPDHEGDFGQWVSVVVDHPETVSLLLDELDTIVGYWHFVPLFEKEFRKMKRGEMSIRQVTSEKIPLLGLPGNYDMYFVIITLSRRHRYTKAVRLLFESFVSTLEELAKEGVYFREFCADAYTPTGIGICRSFEMKLLSKHPDRGEIYARRFFPFPRHALFDQRTELQRLYAAVFTKSKPNKTDLL